MSKKLLLAFLVLVLLPGVLFAGGKKEKEPAKGEKAPEVAVSTKYKEAPELTALVEAGQLPSVDDRLPKEPMEQFVYGEIGKYGGELKRIDNTYAEDFGLVTRWYWPRLMLKSADTSKMYPNLAREVVANDDYSEFTVYIREGTRWSDGEPLTTEDFVFWWEDKKKYFPEEGRKAEELVEPQYVVGGKAMELEPIDDYTFKLKFELSYPLWWSILTMGHNAVEPIPKHYLEQFHPKYAADKESDVEQWKIFEDMTKSPNGKFKNFPTLSPWITVDKIEGARLIQHRNPYYWKVDAEGNQLPYINRIVTDYITEEELILMRIGAGELDMGFLMVPRDRVLWQWQEKGNYKVVWWKYSLWKMWMPNYNYVDICAPEEKEVATLIHERDFSRALAISIDHEYYGELYSFGDTQEGLQYLDPTKAHTKRMKEMGLWDKYMEMYQSYDIEKANELLDGLGLAKGEGGWRYLPSGKRVEISILTRTGSKDEWNFKAAEDVEKNLGIKVWVEAFAKAGMMERLNAGDYMYWGRQQGSRSPFITFDPTLDYSWSEAGKWERSGGTDGVEPTDPTYLKLKELKTKLGNTTDMDKRIEVAIEATEVILDAGWAVINFYADLGFPGIASNRLGNVPVDISADDYFEGWPIALNIEQFYFK